ncbi:hypothetical protein BSIN_2037 [Burkholderia singularis]|uniref:Uncharacterized protein n=1 Tax=Burkholderia singularis TaxID=1503053 RepID=A0A238H0H5_9BURK|nr:hypothetical protein BSIN_2037 [Burkholderia singularis]
MRDGGYFSRDAVKSGMGAPAGAPDKTVGEPIMVARLPASPARHLARA